MGHEGRSGRAIVLGPKAECRKGARGEGDLVLHEHAVAQAAGGKRRVAHEAELPGFPFEVAPGGDRVRANPAPQLIGSEEPVGVVRVSEGVREVRGVEGGAS